MNKVPPRHDQTRRILVRLDANHCIGLAHAIRVAGTLSLLEALREITVVGDGELLAEFFPNACRYLTALDDRHRFPALAAELRPDLVIVDHPHPGEGFWRALRASIGDVPLVAIDDFGGDIDADVVINGTVLDEYHHYPCLGSEARLLAGGRYSLLRRDFGENRWRDPTDTAVTIVVGSGERAREWAHLLASGVIDMRRWGRVRMIVGRAFPDMPRLREECAGSGIVLQSGLSGREMAQAMAEASVVLMTGGMVVYEALAVGVPAVVFPQLDNLIPEARWFAARNCIVDLGFERGMDARTIGDAVAVLLADPAKRAAMSRAQQEVIDGQGMRRAAVEIDRLLQSGRGSQTQSA
jgi:spore coat polysaccharide biosynthesis predicted glycosyltransferase SpsG